MSFVVAFPFLDQAVDQPFGIEAGDFLTGLPKFFSIYSSGLAFRVIPVAAK
jgi:hypothetical protein